MPALAYRKVPQFRLHKPTGQGYVRLNGQFKYLGRYDDPATQQRYHRLIAEWIAGGYLAPVDPQEMTVEELMLRYTAHAREYYRKPDGRLTSEFTVICQALKPLRALYGDSRAADFGPKAMLAVRQRMIEMGWCRKSVNKNTNRIRCMFRWAVERELVPGGVYHALIAVVGLKRGRCAAQERPPVKPVSMDQVNAIQPFVSRQVWALVQLQLLTAARAGELVGIRKGDIDRSGDVWVYTPAEHKTAHYGHQRTIYFGPKAKELLQPFLMRPDHKPLFSPAEAEKERREEMHAARETPTGHGNGPGTNRTPTPRRFAGDQYEVGSYRRAIVRACEIAFAMPAEIQASRADKPATDDTPEQLDAKAARRKHKSMQRRQWREKHCWHPHQLRHTAATELRKQFGLEAARVVLGHRSAAITEVYAEIDRARAVDAMQKVG